MTAISRSLPLSRVQRPYANKTATAATAVRQRTAYSTAVQPPTVRKAGRTVTPQRRRHYRQHDAFCSRLAPGAASPLALSGNEVADSIFEPDILLPSQFFGALGKQMTLRTGECQLLVAVLNDAVHCYQKYVQPRTRRERRLFQEAHDWLMRPDRPAAAVDHPTFSFEYVCEVLSLDPDYLRWGLERWRNQQSLTASLSSPGALDDRALIATA